eukprot:3573522-Pleurochrysis_carterae.AAC.1
MPDSLAIGFRFAGNQKLYVEHIPMPLQLAANKDGKETWQSDSKPVLSKLETILGFTGIVNKDGCAVAKQ